MTLGELKRTMGSLPDNTEVRIKVGPDVLPCAIASGQTDAEKTTFVIWVRGEVRRND